jgi:cellulose synthase operon protein C
MTSLTLHRIALASALAAALTISGCGKKSDADFISSATASLQKGDSKAAVIDLKAALQANAKSGEARFLLGNTLLETGDARGAVVELEKAAELKYSIAKVLPALARALNATGEYKKVAEAYENFTLPDATAQADLKTSVATAFARTRSREQAQKALADALTAAPNFAPALVLKARLMADTRDFAGAQSVLDSVIASDAKNAEALSLKGDIASVGTQDRKAAMDAYRKALEAKPGLVGAHSNIVDMLLAERDTAAAATQVAEMKKALPNHPQTLYFEALLAYLGKDYKKAKELSARVVQAAPTNALALQLAGATEFQLRAFPQAEALLANALKQAPGLGLARLMLAQIQLRSGQPNKTLETLAPVLEGGKPTGEVLALAAEAHLQNGDAKASEELYAKAMKAKPDDAKIRTARAMGQLRQGKGGEAVMDELEAVADSDSGTVANMALISAHLRRNELDQALKAIAALEKKQPDKPVAANLRGRVLVLKNDMAGARASFERALGIDKRYFPAVASLAALDLVEKNPAGSRKRFDDYLKDDPKHVGALMAVANLLSRTGAPKQEVTDALTRAVKAEAVQPGPRLRLIEHHLNTGDPKLAQAVAQDGLAAQPQQAELMQALGRVQISQGELQQAVLTLNKLVALRPDAPNAHLALGEAYLQKKEFADAEKSFRKALALRPEMLQAQRALVATAVGERRYADALAIARDIQKQRPKEGLGHLLEGDIESSRKNADAAANAYRASLQKTPSSEVAVRLHALLLGSGKGADADRFAAGWEKDNPKDAVFVFHRADVALAKRDLPLAETRYRAVLALQPNNALALNNIAWLMVQQGRPGALELALRATEILPNQPAMLDTLASAYAADKKLPQALEAQKKAVSLAPQDNGLRLNLAKLLVDSGDKSAARMELQLLDKLGTSFPQQPKVQELLNSVKS